MCALALRAETLKYIPLSQLHNTMPKSTCYGGWHHRNLPLLVCGQNQPVTCRVLCWRVDYCIMRCSSSQRTASEQLEVDAHADVVMTRCGECGSEYIGCALPRSRKHSLPTTSPHPHQQSALSFLLSLLNRPACLPSATQLPRRCGEVLELDHQAHAVHSLVVTC
jgi:hypothetical protein